MSRKRCKLRDFHLVESPSDYYCYTCNKVLNFLDEFKILGNYVLEDQPDYYIEQFETKED